MRKGGKILALIGAAVMVVGIIAGIVGVTQSVSGMNRLSHQMIHGSSQRIASEAGAEWMVIGNTYRDALCRVEGPEGFVPYDPDRSSTLTINGRTIISQGRFTAPVAGEYQVDCQEYTSQIAIVESGAVTKAIVGMIVGVMGFVGAGLMLPVTILGLILWLVGRNKEKNSAGGGNYPGGGYPGGYPQPGGQPGGHPYPTPGTTPPPPGFPGASGYQAPPGYPPQQPPPPHGASRD